MHAGVGYSELPDSAAAGRQAVEQALGAGQGRLAQNGAGRCDLVLLFCTARHDQRLLRAAVAGAVGDGVPVYGGGAVGVVTNEAYGYAGDQVGVACLWLEGATCEAFVDGGLTDGERDAGLRLGKQMAASGLTPRDPALLFYEAIARNDAQGVQMLMATWILEGLERSLGFMPNLAGAGLMGDHNCSPTSQYNGADTARHQAAALVFGGGIHMDSVVMHGCVPVSDYYTVTKADGPVILEINRRPALAFMDEILESAIAPEQYPFFLLFGVNHGPRYGPYDEDLYASRLCLDIDPARGGIVMFEPDMVEGTEFQLMGRAYNLDYMQAKFNAAFDRLNGRKPVFALYVDCAGRCAGYSGTDIEDALIMQRAVAGRVPALGLYAGVEIGPVNGIPRSLDWAGVFCLFSQGPAHADGAGRELKRAAPAPEPPWNAETRDTVILRLCEQNAARMFTLDLQSLALRYELELKRRGFSLLAELAVSLRHSDDHKSMFRQTAQRINAALNMQKTVLLLADGKGRFTPFVLQGFTTEEQEYLYTRSIQLPDGLLELCPAVITSARPPGLFAPLSEEYSLPYFIASRVFMQGHVAALLLTGRLTEQQPYLTRLSPSDMETVRAIAGLLGSTLERQRLQDMTALAERDGLTGLWNRHTFRRLVEAYLNGEERRGNGKRAGAFLYLDVDDFRTINNTYGHSVGDEVLKASADAMRKALRDTDIIGRQGGDEFVIFCAGLQDSRTAQRKAAQLVEAWHRIAVDGINKPLSASIGVALFPLHGQTFDELCEKADVALYRTKGRGCDGYTLYE